MDQIYLSLQEHVRSWLQQFPYAEVRVAATTAILALVTYKVINILVISPYKSPLKLLPGPEADSILFGNLSKVFKAEAGKAHEEWAAKYGPTFHYRGLGMSRRFSTLDPRAVAHILNHGYDYPKPPQLREALTQILGNGVLAAEGDEHKRQRRIMNPCFTNTNIREVMPIFYSKAFELRDIWLHEISEHGGKAEVEVLTGLSRMTLDVIGLAGFNYDFNSLVEGETNELAKAFQEMLEPQTSFRLFPLLQSRIAILGLIPTERARIAAHSRAVINRVGNQLVQEKKQAILSEKDSYDVKSHAGKDLLSILVHANMATDLKESERMSDGEMIGQITTMLLAGHETTSATTMWLLYDLAKPKYRHIQDRLRKELLTVKSNEPTMEELNALEYLDAVSRENLRINAVVSSTIRQADKDDLIPLSTPVKCTDGVERTEIPIAKGESVFLSIVAINRSKEIWGEDAHEFNPERWLNPSTHPRSHEVAGVYSDILTFIGGPRHCIGHRFAVNEMKVLIFSLVRDIVYSLPEPELEVERRSGIVTRPVIKLPDGTTKHGMPLILTPTVGSD